jgi:hypothetical protein
MTIYNINNVDFKLIVSFYYYAKMHKHMKT